jgi:hypothetical protein
MLLRTLVLLAFIAALADTLLQGAAALARASLHERAVAASREGFISGLQRAQQWLAENMESQTAPSTVAVPSPYATCTIAGDATCAMTVTTTISTPAPTVAPTSSTCPGTDCVVYLQNNAAIVESRFRVHVSSTVTGASGDVYATRDDDVTFRTYLAPPYASLAGSIDDTIGAVVPNGNGDDGGASSGTPTLVNVEYVQPGSNASPLPGNVWQAQAQHSAPTAPAWSQ